MKFEADTPEAMAQKSPEISLGWFVKKVEQVVQDMLALSAQDDYLVIDRLAVLMPPDRSPKENRATIGDTWSITFQIEVGL